MARIRSIHPGLRTDESFMVLSFAARDFLTSLWMEADDHGVFAWKPLTLKARIFPADNVDVVELLSELTEHKWVKRFEMDGNAYGVCRNFRKWQRPKSPSYVHPFPQEYGNYIGLTNTISEAHPPTPSTTPPKSPQMEEGGDKMEEEKKEPARPSVALPEDFERFWEAYPNKTGKKHALKAWKSAKDRPDLSTILAALDRYVRTKRSDCPWKNPATWINQGCWMDVPASLTAPLQSTQDPEETRWRSRVDNWRKSKSWMSHLWGPPPDDPGCKAPKSILEPERLSA